MDPEQVKSKLLASCEQGKGKSNMDNDEQTKQTKLNRIKECVLKGEEPFMDTTEFVETAYSFFEDHTGYYKIAYDAVVDDSMKKLYDDAKLAIQNLPDPDDYDGEDDEWLDAVRDNKAVYAEILRLYFDEADSTILQEAMDDLDGY